MKGVTVLIPQMVPEPHNFNPHTREGCDDLPKDYTDEDIWISIHTPVKGVTQYVHRQLTLLDISIHTPVKGVTVKTL